MLYNDENINYNPRDYNTTTDSPKIVTKLKLTMVNNKLKKEVHRLSNSVFSRIFAVLENYLEIKDSKSFQKLMSLIKIPACFHLTKRGC